MMARYHESLLPVLEELGIGFVAFSPLEMCIRDRSGSCNISWVKVFWKS